jgi:YesN/AraC family two-component response regulator
MDVLRAKNKKLLDEADNRRFQMRLQMAVIAIVSVFVGIIGVFYVRLKKFVRSLYKLNVEQSKATGIIAPLLKKEQQLEETDQQLYALYVMVLQKLEEERMFENPVLAIQDICDSLKSNRSYVSMAINKFSSTNFAGMVSRLWVNEARKLLLDTDQSLTLTDISTRVGFSNRVSFYRQFKDHTGFSPNEFTELTLRQV